VLPVGVVPVLVGPLQVLLALLPALLAALGGVLIALFKPSTVKKLLRLLWVQRVPVAIGAAILALLFYGLPRLLAGGGRVAAEAGAASYPMFRGGPERRGWVPGADDPTAGGKIWASTRAARTFYSSPAVAGKYLYIASAEKGVFSDKGNIVCLDATTGELVWKDDLSGYRATFSSPAVSGDYVVCGEGLHVTTDARVVCLDRRTGKAVWEFRTASHVESSPCVYQGRVYVGAGDDGYYCFALEGDGAGKPKVLWHKAAKDYPDSETPPVAHDGKVYAGLGLGGRAVCCFDAATGQELWRLATPYPVFAAPTVAEGKLFIGMGNGNYVATAEEAWSEQLAKLKEKKASAEEIARAEKEAAKGGAVWCIDLATRQKLWDYGLADVVLGAIAAGHGRIYFGCRDGSFHSVSMDGKPVARWNALSPIMTSPALAGGHVYFVTSKGVLYGLDAATLEPRWQATLWASPPGSGDYFFSSPIAANGHVYVGTPTEGIVCVGSPGKPPEPVWAGYLGGPGQSGRADESPLPEKLDVAWTYVAGAPDEDLQVTGPLAFLDGALYVPARRNRLPGLAKLVLNSDPSKRATEAWFVQTANPVLLSPAAGGGVVYVVDGKQGDKGRQLRALAAAGGREGEAPAEPRLLWARPVEDDAGGDLVLGAGHLLVTSQKEGVACLATESLPRVSDPREGTRPGYPPAGVKPAGEAPGTLLWSYGGSRCVGAPVEAEGRVCVALLSPSRLVVLDSLKGEALWGRELPSPPTTGPILAGETVCVGLESGVCAFALIDGRPLWRQAQVGRVAAPLVYANGQIACVNAQLALFLLKLANGAVVRTQEGLAGPFPPLLTPSELFLSRERGGIARTATEGEQMASTWLRLPRTEKILTPLVVAKSHVYLGTTRGLVCARPAQ